MKGLRILKAFLDALAEDGRNSELYGREIMKRARLLGGSLYPLLIKFEQQGLLESRWEENDPSDEGRPPRRLYRITTLGEQVAGASLTELKELLRGWTAAKPAMGEVKR